MIYPKRTHFEVHQGYYNPGEGDFTFGPVGSFGTEKEAERFFLEAMAEALPAEVLTQSKSKWRAAYKGPPLAIVRVTTQTTDYAPGAKPSWATMEPA